MQRMKYVRLRFVGFIVWPDMNEVYHKDVASTAKRKNHLAEAISAGFCQLQQGRFICFGRSESLDLGGLPDDEAALNTQFGLQS